MGVHGKRRGALRMMNIIHATCMFYVPVTSEAFRVEVASSRVLVRLNA